MARDRKIGRAKTAKCGALLFSSSELTLDAIDRKASDDLCHRYHESMSRSVAIFLPFPESQFVVYDLKHWEIDFKVRCTEGLTV